MGGFEFKIQTTHGVEATTNIVTLTNKAAIFQIGDNQDLNTKLVTNDMSAASTKR